MSDLKQMYSEFDVYNKLFKAKTYKDAVEDFYGKYSSLIYEWIAKVESETDKLDLPESEEIPEEVKVIIENVADEFIAESAEALKIKDKLPKGRHMMDINIYVVMYVFPAFVATGRPYAHRLADTIAFRWKDTFKNSELKVADYDTIDSGFKRRLCYITTAVCESLGRDDDCYELNLLRNFRDGYMLTTKGGEQMVEQYYETAPAIVSAINTRSDSAEVYKDIYNEYILPCISMIEAGKMEECMNHYKDMVEHLS